MEPDVKTHLLGGTFATSDDEDFELFMAELRDDFEEHCYKRQDKATILVDQAKNYSLTAAGRCHDQDHWWEGKMAAYAKKLQPQKASRNNTRNRPRRFDEIDAVLEQYWEDGVLPDCVTEQWLDEAIEYTMFAKILNQNL